MWNRSLPISEVSYNRFSFIDRRITLHVSLFLRLDEMVVEKLIMKCVSFFYDHVSDNFFLNVISLSPLHLVFVSLSFLRDLTMPRYPPNILLCKNMIVNSLTCLSVIRHKLKLLLLSSTEMGSAFKLATERCTKI